MVVIVVTVAVRGPGVELELKGDPSERWSLLNSGFFEAIGVISFAFVCHHNSLLIYGSLRTPTIDRFARVTHVSTMISVFACLCMSTSGFLVFTSKTQGNILNNFADDDTLINIARACVSRVISSPPPAWLTADKLVRSLGPTCLRRFPSRRSSAEKSWRRTTGQAPISTSVDT